MKKMIVCIWMVVCLFGTAACGLQKEEGEKRQDMPAGNIYVYEKEGFGGSFAIRLYDDGTFQYYEGYYSSYIGRGDWVLEDGILVLSEEDGYRFVNRFKVDGSDLVFLAENSSNFLYVKAADGERFTVSSKER